MTITPDRTGVFSVVCNEYCGVGHHTMVGKIHVVEPGQPAPAAESGG
jgi:cytochrome c oxidase subunit 2